MKSSPPQQDAVVETWTVDFLVLGQAVYHSSYPATSKVIIVLSMTVSFFQITKYIFHEFVRKINCPSDIYVDEKNSYRITAWNKKNKRSKRDEHFNNFSTQTQKNKCLKAARRGAHTFDFPTWKFL